jgi:hypothetical protein
MRLMDRRSPPVPSLQQNDGDSNDRAHHKYHHGELRYSDRDGLFNQ